MRTLNQVIKECKQAIAMQIKDDQRYERYLKEIKELEKKAKIAATKKEK